MEELSPQRDCRRMVPAQVSLILVVSLLFLTTMQTSVRAASQLSPVLHFDVFDRRLPEALPIVRQGFGLILQKEIRPDWMLQTGFFYTSENSTFPSEYSYEERIYRARFGLLRHAWRNSAFVLSPVVGAQWSIHQTTVVPLQDKNLFLWAPYLGFHFEVVPVAGFGTQAGIWAYWDSYLTVWIPQFFLGLVF